MKTVITLCFALCFFSCAKKNNLLEKTAELPIENKIVGGDVDAHGCKPSAGYTWSEVKKECIRIFEIGVRLDHYNDTEKKYTTSAFVVFEENGNRAELFLDTQAERIILERKTEGQPWVNNKWILESWKGFSLKYENKILYRSEK